MTSEEIKALAHKYHTPGAVIRDDWHHAYQEECRKINRQEIEKKYDVSGKANKKAQKSPLLT